MLFFHEAISDAARSKLESIKSDYRAIGVTVRNTGAQAVFSSTLPRKGKGVRRRALIKSVNNWLWRWCWQEGFGFYDNGTLFEDQCVLERDGMHLAK